MQKNIIVANWKMNPATKKEAIDLFEAVKKGVKNAKKVEVVICPPFVYLPLFFGLTLGAQNTFYKERGAFTGEISPLQLRDLKVEYVIVGHSEARRYLKETNQAINKKIKELLWLKLKPILCVGETIEEKELGEKNEVLENQIKDALKYVSSKELENIVIAYEPVWAIGTGHNCSVDEMASSVSSIRKIISELYGEGLADAVRVIYGGSVDSSNAGSYIGGIGINGLLVGGGSLHAEEFINIVKTFKF